MRTTNAGIVGHTRKYHVMICHQTITFCILPTIVLADQKVLIIELFLHKASKFQVEFIQDTRFIRFRLGSGGRFRVYTFFMFLFEQYRFLFLAIKWMVVRGTVFERVLPCFSRINLLYRDLINSFLMLETILDFQGENIFSVLYVILMQP